MQALELKRNEWVKGMVKKGKYSYFKFKHKCTKGRVCIQLKTASGDPDIYVGNHQVLHRTESLPYAQPLHMSCCHLPPRAYRLVRESALADGSARVLSPVAWAGGRDKSK
jgi:hypothetical protein